MTTEQRVRDFLIEENRWLGAPEELTSDVQLIADRVLDSMMVMRLTAWLEQEFSISIQHSDVVPANFATTASIAELVDRRRAAA